jgi:hypothetical protein
MIRKEGHRRTVRTGKTRRSERRTEREEEREQRAENVAQQRDLQYRKYLRIISEASRESDRNIYRQTDTTRQRTSKTTLIPSSSFYCAVSDRATVPASGYYPIRFMDFIN